MSASAPTGATADFGPRPNSDGSQSEKSERLDFDRINEAALDDIESLMRDWFPHGRKVKREWHVGSIHGEAGDSFRINLDTGLWAEFYGGVPSGGDMISLAAAKFHNDKQGKGAQMLADRFGMPGGTAYKANGSANGTYKAAEEPKRQDKAPEWQSMIPPPVDAGKPPESMLSGYDQVHEYTSLDDRVTHYVGRKEARNGDKKTFLPVTYGTLFGVTGWHRKGPDSPKPLYGLNRLSSMPGAPVLLLEGEKKADAAQRMLTNYACLSWTGGTAGALHADLSPLAGRKVTVWPDADEPGRKAAENIANAAVKAGAKLRGIVRTEDLSDKFDAANLEAEGCDDPDAWLLARLPPVVDPEKQRAALRALLDIHAWVERDIPEQEPLLGSIVTKTTRTFIIGKTGLGKTMLGFAIACGLASGEGFCDWRSSRPARVVYIDGEMPGELIKARAIDALRRMNIKVLEGMLFIFGSDIDEEARKIFPDLPPFAPFNTDEGRKFLLALFAAIGDVDVSFFDNVMSLLIGAQKEEETWNGVDELVKEITRMLIGQVWFDHTGWNSTRQYGASSKAWCFDAVGVMTALPTKSHPMAVEFNLTFDPAKDGKCRRRTPDNWDDFADRSFRLVDDRWTSERLDPPETPIGGASESDKKSKSKVKPGTEEFYRQLTDITISANGDVQSTTSDEWYKRCAFKGLTTTIEADDTKSARDKKTGGFRARKSELKAERWIDVSGEVVTPLRGLLDAP